MPDPRLLLPRHKKDLDAVRAVIALGYPAVDPVLRDLFEWTQDANWPVAAPIADFLVSVGAPVVPLIAEVLAGTDSPWKYWCITLLVQRIPATVVAPLRADLARLAEHPSEEDRANEVDVVAREALDARAARS